MILHIALKNSTLCQKIKDLLTVQATAIQWDRFMNRRLASLFYISLGCFWIWWMNFKLSGCGDKKLIRSPVQRKSEKFPSMRWKKSWAKNRFDIPTYTLEHCASFWISNRFLSRFDDFTYRSQKLAPMLKKRKTQNVGGYCYSMRSIHKSPISQSTLHIIGMFLDVITEF
jgi:hypothetical protein